MEVTINDDDDTNKEWIIDTMSNAAGRLQLVKVLASQLLYNFDKLARHSDDFPTQLISDAIDNILETGSVNPPFGDDNLCNVSLLLMIPMSYEHGLMTGTLSLCQPEQVEEYHPIMGLWGDTMHYQFSSRPGMSALIFKSQARGTVIIFQLQEEDDEPFIQSIRHCLEMLKKHNIQSWLEDNPDQNAPCEICMNF
eukprot:9489920-Ditylum_brightwellii.AAC.1